MLKSRDLQSLESCALDYIESICSKFTNGIENLTEFDLDQLCKRIAAYLIDKDYLFLTTYWQPILELEINNVKIEKFFDVSNFKDCIDEYLPWMVNCDLKDDGSRLKYFMIARVQKDWFKSGYMTVYFERYLVRRAVVRHLTNIGVKIVEWEKGVSDSI